MSVLNQMLRDLEKRGAMPDLVAAAGTATVARPALPMSERKMNLPRRWIWTAVLATAAAFVGVHSWLNYRVQEAATPRAPLGERQFGSVVASRQPAPTAAPPAIQAPAPAVPAARAPVTPPVQTATREMPKVNSATPRAERPASAPRAQIAAVAPAPAAPAKPAVAESAAQAVVARSSSDVSRDVDRAADLIARGRASEAMELLAQILNRQPTHVGARSSLAALLAEAGRREQALHVLLAGSEVDTRFATPAAQLQAEMGDLNGALQTLARVPVARRSAGFDALHAGIAQRAGDHMTAVNAYRRALAQPQPEAVWWVGLGVSLEATGEPAEARNAYTRAAGEAKLPADVRRYVADRLAVLDSRTDGARKASLANTF